MTTTKRTPRPKRSEDNERGYRDCMNGVDIRKKLDASEDYIVGWNEAYADWQNRKN